MQYDCFLTHDWGEDEEGRSNHARVGKLSAALKAEGIRPWFDEECMRGDINDKMVPNLRERFLATIPNKSNTHTSSCAVKIQILSNSQYQTTLTLTRQLGPGALFTRARDVADRVAR